MNNLFFYEIKYENICEHGIFALYNSSTYQIKEFDFNIKKIKNKFSLEYKQIYSYFLEDSHYFSISEYLSSKYKKEDIIFLMYASFDLDISDKNKELYKLIENEIKMCYESDLTSFST